MGKRIYSRDEVMEAASVYYLTRSLTRTSEKTGIPITTIQTWNDAGDQAFQHGLELAAKISDKKHAAKMRQTMNLYLEELANPEKIKQCKSRDAGWIVAVLNDKIRVMEEKPTSITARDNKATERRLNEIEQELLKRAEKRGNTRLTVAEMFPRKRKVT